MSTDLEMNIEEIQRAIIKLPPDELARFREWFEDYESNATSGEFTDLQTPVEEILKKVRGIGVAV